MDSQASGCYPQFKTDKTHCPFITVMDQHSMDESTYIRAWI